MAASHWSRPRGLSSRRRDRFSGATAADPARAAGRNL